MEDLLRLALECIHTWKSSCSMNRVCVVGSKENFKRNSRLSMHSNKMDRAWQTPQQHWSTMLYKKAKEDNKKTMLEDIGVMKLTQELVALRGKVWVLIPMSLTLMVQRSTQHH